MIVKKFCNDNSQDVRSSNFCQPERFVLVGLVSCKNCLENKLAIPLDKDLKRVGSLIYETIIFINL